MSDSLRPEADQRRRPAFDAECRPSILPLLWPRCGAALSSSQGFDRVSESMTTRTRETDGETGRAPLHCRILPTDGGRTDFRAPWVASGYVQVCLNRFNGGGSTRPGTVKRPACPMVSQRLKGAQSPVCRAHRCPLILFDYRRSRRRRSFFAAV